MSSTTDVAVRESDAPVLRLPSLPSLPDTDSWIRAMASIAKLADQICDTSFVPKGLRGDAAAVTAAILTGRELDMPPMTALRHIHVVEGTPSLDAEYKRSRVLAAGHEFRIIEWDDEHCKVAARRRGDRGQPLVMEYKIADARRAGLVKDRGNYITRPKVMLLARITTLVCNAIFADVTNGLATAELLEAGDEDAIADAIGAAVDAPPPPRVTGEEIRSRPRRRANPVTGEVIPDATPQEPEPDADPRDAVIAELDRLNVTGPDIAAYLTRLAGKPLASVESLNRMQAEWFTGRLAKLGSRDELEAAAVAAEARREQDAAAEAGDVAPAMEEVPGDGQ